MCTQLCQKLIYLSRMEVTYPAMSNFSFSLKYEGQSLLPKEEKHTPGDYEWVFQKLCVLRSNGFIFHEAEVDKVYEVDCEDVLHSIVIGCQLGRVAMHHLKTHLLRKGGEAGFP